MSATLPAFEASLFTLHTSHDSALDRSGGSAGDAISPMTDSQPHPPEAHSHSKSPSGSPVELGARVNWNPLGDLRPPSEAPYAYHEHLPTNAINTFHEESAQRVRAPPSATATRTRAAS